MTTTQFLTELLQGALGEQYKVCPNHAFQRDFLKPMLTPYGTQYDINFQAFGEYADTIVCVVETRSADDYATPYVFSSATFTASFWVPVNTATHTGKPKFTFDADMAKLKETLTRGTHTLVDGAITLRASVSCGEPFLLSTSQEQSGAYTRIVMQVGGRIGMADKRAGIGGDLEIALVIDGRVSRFSNVTNVLIGSTVMQNAMEQSDALGNNQRIAGFAQGVSFSVDDFDDGSAAFKLIEKRALENAVILREADTEDGRMKIPVRIYKNDVLRAEFVGAIEAQYAVASKNAYGQYSVSIAADAGD